MCCTKIYNEHCPKLVFLRSYLFVGISVVTLERMQMDMREFMVVRRFEGCNLGGDRILEFAVTRNLVVSNSLFTKRERHLVTYQSGENLSHIDYILVKLQNIKLVRDLKVISNEECVTQQNLLVCDARIVKGKDWFKKFVPKRCAWKLQQVDRRDEF